MKSNNLHTRNPSAETAPQVLQTGGCWTTPLSSIHTMKSCREQSGCIAAEQLGVSLVYPQPEAQVAYTVTHTQSLGMRNNHIFKTEQTLTFTSTGISEIFQLLSPVLASPKGNSLGDKSSSLDMANLC